MLHKIILNFDSGKSKLSISLRIRNTLIYIILFDLQKSTIVNLHTT